MAKTDKVFPYEMDDDVVIAFPGGDSLGVEESQLKREIDALHKIIDCPDTQRIVVDLGAATYFSSVVIGAVMALCTKAQRAGGQAAICNAADSVYDTLLIMRLPDVIPYHQTREAALQAVREDAEPTAGP